MDLDLFLRRGLPLSRRFLITWLTEIREKVVCDVGFGSNLFCSGSPAELREMAEFRW